MPQLDINTFWYQYTGIMFLLITTYIVVSYIILPILLRVIFVRSKYTETISSLKDLSYTVSESRFIQLLVPSRSLIVLETKGSDFVRRLSVRLNTIMSLVSSTTSCDLALPSKACTSSVKIPLPAYLQSLAIYILLTTELESNE